MQEQAKHLAEAVKVFKLGACNQPRRGAPALTTAELRRLIELGYAAEQAGFILDGTILRYAGRAWDTQPDLRGEGNRSASPEKVEETQPAQPQPGRAEREDTGVNTGRPSKQQGEAKTKGHESKSALQSNLRSLSV